MQAGDRLSARPTCTRPPPSHSPARTTQPGSKEATEYLKVRATDWALSTKFIRDSATRDPLGAALPP